MGTNNKTPNNNSRHLNGGSQTVRVVSIALLKHTKSAKNKKTKSKPPPVTEALWSRDGNQHTDILLAKASTTANPLMEKTPPRELASFSLHPRNYTSSSR